MNGLVIEQIAIQVIDSAIITKKALATVDYRALAEKAAYTAFSVGITLCHLYVALGIDAYRLLRRIYQGLQQQQKALPPAPEYKCLPAPQEIAGYLPAATQTVETTATPVSRVLITPAPQATDRVIYVSGKTATVTELRKLAKDQGFKGVSKTTKEKLMQLLFNSATLETATVL